MRLSRYFPNDRPAYYGQSVPLSSEINMIQIPTKTDHETLEGYLGQHCPSALERYQNYHQGFPGGIPRLNKHRAVELIASSGVAPQSLRDFAALCTEKGWK